ncbi:MAG: molecular chaperone [Acidimicrobiia bacterium]
MATYRRRPGDILGFPEEMRRLLDIAWETHEVAGRRGVWAPPVDIYETPEEVRILIDLPGLKADSLDVTIERNVLTVKGDRRLSNPQKDGKFLRIERPSGTFHRAIGLPDGVQSDRVSASLKDGVLTITVPKGSSARPRKIAIVTDENSDTDEE